MMTTKIRSIVTVSAVAALSAALTFSTSANAAENKAPDMFGRLSAGVLKVDTRDVQAWMFKADLGVKGLYTVDDHLKLSYQLVADFAGEINKPDTTGVTWTSGDSGSGATGDIYVHTARVFVMTDYGLILIAPRTISGHWVQLYGNVDKFDYNRMHGQTGKIAIFAQIEQAKNVLAYVSPEVFKHTRIIGAMLTTSDTNHRDDDVLAARAVYNDGKLNAGIGHVWVSKAAMASTKDYDRTALTAGYDFGKVVLGATYEINRNHPAGNWNAYAVTGEYKFNDKWSATLGYADSELNNNKAVIGNVRYKFNKNAYFFAETGQYTQAVDNMEVGINIKF